MSDEVKVDTSFIIRNVRLSFPVLFEAEQFDGNGAFNYSAAFLVDPGSQNDKTIRAAIKKAATNIWKEKADTILKSIEGQNMKYCYLDGNTKAYDGYENKWVLSAKRPKESGRPKVIDKDPKVEIGVEEGRPYGGCIVHAKIQVWAQHKGKGAPGIRCSLMTVQFVADGESFGGAPPANTEGFEEVEATEDLT